MKKAGFARKDVLREEYRFSDFRHPTVLGKYAARMKDISNIVVLSPQVATVFHNDAEVNRALLSLIRTARSSATGRGTATRRGQKRAA
ncbi:MAG: hypothetical protein HY897_03590 [Deltaproteobacteria bacterium]|nr:hypothetical protein [Deltaproteobacteria bacterium]